MNGYQYYGIGFVHAIAALLVADACKNYWNVEGHPIQGFLSVFSIFEVSIFAVWALFGNATVVKIDKNTDLLLNVDQLLWNYTTILVGAIAAYFVFRAVRAMTAPTIKKP